MLHVKQGMVVFVVLLCASFSLQAGPRKEKLRRWEFGGHYTLLNIPSNRVGCGGCRANNSGFGGRLGYNFYSWLGVESEINFFPDPGQGATNLDGGRITQGLFGVKAGVRRQKWSLFAKARPGFVSFGRAIVDVFPTPPPFSFGFGRITHYAIDVGGIVQYHLSSRTAIRFDLGDTIVRYGGQRGITPTVRVNNFQLATGIVFRF